MILSLYSPLSYARSKYVSTISSPVITSPVMVSSTTHPVVCSASSPLTAGITSGTISPVAVSDTTVSHVFISPVTISPVTISPVSTSPVISIQVSIADCSSTEPVIVIQVNSLAAIRPFACNTSAISSSFNAFLLIVEGIYACPIYR